MDRRVSFDFEIEFSNGGGIQGQGFRLDVHGEDISEGELADYIVKDLRLLMVKEVRILNKRIIFEQHKRSAAPAAAAAPDTTRLIDLSQPVNDNVATRLNCDAGRLQLDQLAELDGVVIRISGADSREVDWQALAASDVRGKAVLVQTDWAQHWGTARYFEGHPYLTPAAATYLRDRGAALVGIDSPYIEDTSTGSRPVRTILLGAGIPFVESLRDLDQLPIEGFTFTAVPPRTQRQGFFAVRAYARLTP